MFVFQRRYARGLRDPEHHRTSHSLLTARDNPVLFELVGDVWKAGGMRSGSTELESCLSEATKDSDVSFLPRRPLVRFRRRRQVPTLPRTTVRALGCELGGYVGDFCEVEFGFGLVLSHSACCLSKE